MCKIFPYVSIIGEKVHIPLQIHYSHHPPLFCQGRDFLRVGMVIHTVFVFTTNSSCTSSFYTINKYLSKNLTDQAEYSRPLNNTKVSGADPHGVKNLCKPIDTPKLSRPWVSEGNWFQDPLGYPNPQMFKSLFKIVQVNAYSWPSTPSDS